jgi:broad specificity phosphatase PhoE
MPITQKSFYMVRHGQSVGNRDGYFAGSMDVALTDEGIAQAKRAHHAINNHDKNNAPTVVIHSALSRAKDTAKIINNTLKLDMIENAQLNEQHFGDWEGQDVAQFIDCYKTKQTPKNGESFDDFNLRVKNALNNVLEAYEKPLIVCHGGVFRAFHAHYGIHHARTENAVIHYFSPNNKSAEMPWDITKILA